MQAVIKRGREKEDVEHALSLGNPWVIFLQEHCFNCPYCTIRIKKKE